MTHRHTTQIIAKVSKPIYRDDLVTLYRGEALDVLAGIDAPSGGFDAVITDPPYSSGGLIRGDRTRDPTAKYQHTGTVKSYPSMTGDGRDGRGWQYWSALWLGRCLELTREHGYALTFTDWRMLPLATDAMQAGGFVWRGIIAWDKTESSRSPHTGYFRHQCEYVVWGTRGVSRAQAGGPWPGCVRERVVPAEKLHLTAKPLGLMRQLVQCVPRGGTVLDPFAGSATTILAARLEGRRAVGIEREPGNCAVAVERLRAAAKQHRS